VVNFRFHLVSLTAVFLALAAGITIGAGVVDRATVDQIERQLSDVDARREATNSENDRLRADLGRWTQYGEQLGDRPLQGRLAGSTVLFTATTGIDRNVVDALRTSVTEAGGTVDGTVWFTNKWKLDNDDDVKELAGILDAPPTTKPADLRNAAIAGMGGAWSTGDGGALVTALEEQGFLQFEEGPVPVVPLAELPRQGSLFVVVSGDSADVAPADLAQPLVSRLVDSDHKLLVVQPQRPPAAAESTDEPPPEFVAAVRADGAIASRLSTVDNIDDLRGRAAAVLALSDLQGTGRTGHYGFGPDTRVLPEPAR
jgi:hypothetical protein